jgi:hypothetical protein
MKNGFISLIFYIRFELSFHHISHFSFEIGAF